MNIGVRTKRNLLIKVCDEQLQKPPWEAQINSKEFSRT